MSSRVKVARLLDVFIKLLQTLRYILLSNLLNSITLLNHMLVSRFAKKSFSDTFFSMGTVMAREEIEEYEHELLILHKGP